MIHISRGSRRLGGQMCFSVSFKALNLFHIGKPSQSVGEYFSALGNLSGGELYESVQPPTRVYLSEMVSLVSLVTSSLVVIKYSTGILWMTRDSLNGMKYLLDGTHLIAADLFVFTTNWVRRVKFGRRRALAHCGRMSRCG